MEKKGNIMLRQLLITAAVALAMPLAYAGEAGKIIFVAGTAQVVDRAAAEGERVQEGELLSTGADGFIYVKTIDNGLFIVRPNSKARIVSYRIDAANPANTRIKLELLSGVARSRSGDAVKLARQNFRFNTPVAAIGVRGTDFTVFTDNDTSRVAVISGGIVVSGFAGACRPEGIGPCDGSTSRELSSAQRGQLLQVQRGNAAPQLLQGGVGPDEVSPPRGDEPIGKNAGVNSSTAIPSSGASLDAKKTEFVGAVAGQLPAPAPAPLPPVVELPPQMPDVIVKPPLPTEPQVSWGRWQSLLGTDPTIAFTAPAGTERLVSGNFAILRNKDHGYVTPEQGSIGFELQGGEAYILNDQAWIRPVLASMSNGELTVDFGKKTFVTAFDLEAGSELFNMRAEGAVRGDGRLFGNSQFTRPTNMNVNGVLSNDFGGNAVYMFHGRLDETRSVDGITYWRK